MQQRGQPEIVKGSNVGDDLALAAVQALEVQAKMSFDEYSGDGDRPLCSPWQWCNGQKVRFAIGRPGFNSLVESYQGFKKWYI